MLDFRECVIAISARGSLTGVLNNARIEVRFWTMSIYAFVCMYMCSLTLADHRRLAKSKWHAAAYRGIPWHAVSHSNGIPRHTAAYRGIPRHTVHSPNP